MSNQPELTIKQDLSPETIVFRAIDRCNTVALEKGEDVYKKAVEVIMDNLHPDKLVEIEGMAEEYSHEVWKYKKRGGRKIGTPENPVNGSPELVKKINHRKLFHLVLKAYNETGTYWRVDKVNAEYGRYPTKIKATPVTNKKKGASPDTKDTKPQTCYILYLNPRTGKHEIKKVMNWHGYALGIGTGESPWFFNSIQASITKQESIVILMTGPPGKGKTYAGMRIAEIFDKKFDPDIQCVMDRLDTMRLISGLYRLKRGQIILIDESQFGMGARRWGEKEQQELMEFMAAARYLGLIIIIVSLHISMIDSIARKHIIKHHIHIEERGRGVIYLLQMGRFMRDTNYYPPRKGQIVLQLPNYGLCAAATCLTCDHNDTCMTIRARYERIKIKFLIDRARKSAEMAEQREKTRMQVPERKIVEHVKGLIEDCSQYIVQKDEDGKEKKRKIMITVMGNIDNAWLQTIIERDFDHKMGRHKSRNLAKKILILYPEITRS